jgi:Ca2+-binding EF-hand superfamily protein
MAVSEELQAEYKECFSILDKNSDNLLTNDEITAVIKGVQPAMDQEEIDAFMTDGGISGSADCPTFTNAMLKKMSCPHTEADLNEAFKVFDPSGTGSIGFDEIEMVLKVLGEQLISEEHREVFLKKAFKSDPKTLNYGEFIKTMLTEIVKPG